MRIVVFIFLVAISGNAFSQKYAYKPDYSTILPKSDGKKLLNQCSRSTPQNIQAYFDVTKEDVEQLEQNFKRLYSLKSKGCCAPKAKVGNLKNYVYQYVGVEIYSKKYIYINALGFFDKKEVQDNNFFFEDWKSRPVIICDGGSMFWGVLYNLESQKFSDLSMNGSI